MAQSTTITAGSTGSVSVPKLSYDQILAIPNPQAGMMAFDSTFKCLKYYDGNKWLCTSQTDNGAVGFAWKKTIYNNGLESAISLTVDSQNNVYMTGSVGNGEVLYGYIVKFSPNGNLIWQYTDLSYQSNIYGDIVVDENSQVYALCNTSFRYSNMAVLKLDANGNLLWRKNGSGQMGSYRYAENIYLDNNKNVYVTGRFSTNLNIDSFSLTAPLGYEGFVMKLANDGTTLWLKSTKNAWLSKVSKTGECYFAGHFTGAVSFDATNLNSLGDEDILIGKYNNDGALAWVKSAGGTGTDKANAIAVDNAGDVYVTGSFSGNANFDTTPVNAVDAEDFYIVKYGTDGSFLWLRNGGGIGIDSGMKIEISAANQPVVLGAATSNSLTFYPNLVLNPSKSPSNFLIKYNADNGNITWAKVIEDALDFRINSSDEIYTWYNIAGTQTQPQGFQHTINKYLGNGTFVYRQFNGGILKDFAFGTDKHFFYVGNFADTVHIGTSTLTSTDMWGDMFISHWMD
ncbi:hypothetical protein GCM10027442_37980 [Emticicia fontis]